MKKANPELTAQRRQQILSAAQICFEEKGFHRASMSAICKQANMSPGHLYHYFKSKEDLIEAMTAEAVRHYEEKLASLAITGDPLEAMLSRTYEIWDDSEDGFSGGLLAELKSEATRNPKVAKIIRSYDQRLRERFANVIRFGQENGTLSDELDPQGLATLIVSIIDGLRIGGEANKSFDREGATEALKVMIRRTFTP